MEGSCLCGAVAFAVDGPGTPIELCHCSRCRKSYGSAFAATFYVERSRLRWTRGEALVRVYDAPIRERPPAYRHAFCAACGSPLPIVREGTEMAEIPAGIVDGDPGVRPARHIFTRRPAEWLEISDDLPRFPEGARQAGTPGAPPRRRT